MNRLQAEHIAFAVRVYVEAIALLNRNPSPKFEAAARLAFERMVDAFVEASRHG